MAKTDKKDKKAVSKKADPIKGKPAVPTSSKEILAKAAALAKSASKKPLPDEKKTSSSDETSSAGEESSSEEVSPPVKASLTAVKKTANSSDDDSSDASSSEESSSEESDNNKVSALVKTVPTLNTPSGASSSEESSSEDGNDDEEMSFIPAQTSPDKGKKTLNPKDDSSDASSSEESSSESDEGDDKTPAPAQNAPTEANKKRKANSEAVAAPKKVKFANGNDNPVTTGEGIKKIFVGNLSWNVDSDWLAHEFAECGEVESAHVQMDRNTGRSRGFGYVHFKTAGAAEKALTLNGKEIDGRAVKIDKSSPPDKKASTEKRAQAFGDVPSPPSAVLFVGNLSFGVDEDALWETFGEHGDIKSIRVPTDRDTGKPKGFAYVEFSDVESAKKACGELQGFELDGRSIRLDFSQPRDSAGGRGGGQGGRGGRGGRGRGGFGSDRGRGVGRGGRGGDRGGRGRNARTGGIAQFQGQKITFG